MSWLRHGLRACGAGLFIAVAASVALAASDQAPPSGAPAKAGTASRAHHGGKAQHPHHAGKPAPHKATSLPEHKKDLAVRPTGASHAGSADKSSEQRPGLGPFSLGVETDPKVKPRSLAGGEVDFDREPGVRSKSDPWYLGLSIKSPFSW
jgi:hypothetical protein